MRQAIIGAVGLAFCLGACGDDGGGGPDGGTTADSAQGNPDAVQQDADTQSDSALQVDGAPETPTFTRIYETVLSQKCTPCHTASSNGNLSLADRNTASLAGRSKHGLRRTRVVGCSR